MYASNRSRDMVERLIRALKTKEREFVAKYLGVPPSFELPHVLRQQIMMHEAATKDPAKFGEAITLALQMDFTSRGQG